MLTGHYDSEGKEVKIGDKWEYHTVVYTVVDDGDIIFKHPRESTTIDDHIEIEHSWRGTIKTD
ncbi:hypothetical protein [Oceanobacillus kimchii]|uniref:DUF1541 domain-containing protein n=1 Tax=Oceanobacillus kimchii TaxID=746691 RepID=A0ABQ5TKT7_9BACI|nr:hypothetical protein [Oceanobacillus kimchii]GLO66199.1 hypothetical protein MACH08_19830 [Oceanobacillus kimchii]